MQGSEKSTQPLKNGRYQHYKGQFYQVLATARHSETREWVVVYRCLYDDYSVWVRPLDMFVESVILDSGASVARFRFVDENSDGFVNSDDGEPVGNFTK